jgi:hypothetical protein
MQMTCEPNITDAGIVFHEKGYYYVSVRLTPLVDLISFGIMHPLNKEVHYGTDRTEPFITAWTVLAQVHYAMETHSNFTGSILSGAWHFHSCLWVVETEIDKRRISFAGKFKASISGRRAYTLY